MKFFNFDLSGIFLYPPTGDQLRMMDLYYGLVDGQILLWVVRILSLVLLIISLWFWFGLVRNFINKKIALISVIVIVCSPVFLVLWLLHPLDCLKIFFVLLIAHLFLKKFTDKNLWVVALFVTIYLLFFSLIASEERASFFHKLGLADGQSETMSRFGAEDSLTDPLIIPLQVKRVVYNKYFLSYKQVINEFIPFFDLETVFFQEVHPMEQKSVVIFYWPEVFLFLVGLFMLVKLKNIKLIKLMLLFFGIALLNFLFSPNQIYRKFEFILLPLSVLIALPIGWVFQNKVKSFGKFLILVVTLFSGYGFLTNMVDINKRPDFWLDNRPLYFDFIYSSLKQKDLNNYDTVRVSSIVGNSEMYCRFYFKRCSKKKFNFISFDLSQEQTTKNTIYAGFVGEFIGSDFKNNINKDWKMLVSAKGINILETKTLRDTIAYKYGNDVVVGEVK